MTEKKEKRYDTPLNEVCHADFDDPNVPKETWALINKITTPQQKREFTVWRKVSELEGVVPLEGISVFDVQGEHTLAARMPMYHGGDLEKYVRKMKQPVPAEHIRAWVLNISFTVQRMHLKGVRHGDIAMRNVFIDLPSKDSQEYKLMVGDFSHSRDVSQDKSPSRFRPDVKFIGYLLVSLMLRRNVDHRNENVLNDVVKKYLTDKYSKLFELAIKLIDDKSDFKTMDQVIAELMKK